METFYIRVVVIDQSPDKRVSVLLDPGNSTF